MTRNSPLRQPGILAATLFYGIVIAATCHAADGVVLFAPGEYEHWKPAPYHAKAAERLRRHLLKAGIPEARIASLTGKQATAGAFQEAVAKTADSTGAKDLFLVIACSQGVRLGDHDCLCAADTPRPLLRTSEEKPSKVLVISEILREMAVCPSNRRILIVDGAGEDDPKLSEAAARFGRQPLESSGGQWVILSRSNSQSRRNGKESLTDFMWSLLDGLTFHADGNRDGYVSVLELADYMKLYAEEQRSQAPRVAGKTSDDISLLRTCYSDEEVPRAELIKNAKQLTSEARKTLLLDMDVAASLALLDRATRLCNQADLKQEIDELSATAKILRGDAKRVLPEILKEGAAEYTAVLPRGAGLYAPEATTPSLQLPPGTVVRLTHRVPSSPTSDVAFVAVVAAWRPTWKSGEVLLSVIPMPGESLWVFDSDLAAGKEQAVPSEPMRQEFMKFDQPDRATSPKNRQPAS